MKKNLKALLWCIAMLAFISCRKQAANDYADHDLQKKVSSWLTQPKILTTTPESGKHSLLIKNLDFSLLSLEKSGGG